MVQLISIALWLVEKIVACCLPKHDFIVVCSLWHQIIDSDGTVSSLSSDAAESSFDTATDNFINWNVTIAESGLSRAADGVVLVAICSPYNLILSRVDYGEEKDDPPAVEEVFSQPSSAKSDKTRGTPILGDPDVTKEIEASSHDEKSMHPVCSQLLKGFSLWDRQDGKRVTLADHMILSVDDWSHEISFEASTVDDSVGSVVFVESLDGGKEDQVSDSPFQSSADWIHSRHGPTQIQANAYESQTGALLASCVIHVIIESTTEQSCGPAGLTGFLFVDSSGQPVTHSQLNRLRNGQILPPSLLPDDVDLAVTTNENTEAVVFQINGSGDVYSLTGPLFRMNSHDFQRPGFYVITARAYNSTDFFHIINTCEISFHVLGDEASGDGQRSEFQNKAPSFESTAEEAASSENHAVSNLGPAREKRHLVTCDFSSLPMGSSLSDTEQKDTLAQQCGFEITGSSHDGSESIPVIIGSPPNVRRHGDGSCAANAKRGLRGLTQESSISSAFTKLADAKSVQFDPPDQWEQEEQTRQEDIACMHIDFLEPVDLDGLSTIMGVKDAEAKVIVSNILYLTKTFGFGNFTNVSFVFQVMDSNGEGTEITSPPNSNENCTWQVHISNPELKLQNAVLVTICLSKRGALSFLSYFSKQNMGQTEDVM